MKKHRIKNFWLRLRGSPFQVIDVPNKIGLTSPTNKPKGK